MTTLIAGPMGLKEFVLRFGAPLTYLASLGSLFLVRASNRTQSNFVVWSLFCAVVLGGILVCRRSPIQALGLDFRHIPRNTWGWILGLMVVDNLMLALIQSLDGAQYQARMLPPLDLLTSIFSPWIIAKFGEELLFRGFLLLDSIHSHPRAFWIANALQATLFTWIHLAVNLAPGAKRIFVPFVFAFAFGLAALNRTRRSLLPSTLIHATGGTFIEIFFRS